MAEPAAPSLNEDPIVPESELAQYTPAETAAPEPTNDDPIVSVEELEQFAPATDEDFYREQSRGQLEQLAAQKYRDGDLSVLEDRNSPFFKAYLEKGRSRAIWDKGYNPEAPQGVISTVGRFFEDQYKAGKTFLGQIGDLGTAPYAGETEVQARERAKRAAGNLAQSVGTAGNNSLSMLRVGLNRVANKFRNEKELDDALFEQFRAGVQTQLAIGGIKEGTSVFGAQVPVDPTVVEEASASMLADPLFYALGANSFGRVRGGTQLGARTLEASSKAETVAQKAAEYFGKAASKVPEVGAKAAAAVDNSAVLRGLGAATFVGLAGGNVDTTLLAGIFGSGTKLGIFNKVAKDLAATADGWAGRAPMGPMSRAGVAFGKAAAREGYGAMLGQIPNVPFLLGADTDDARDHLFLVGLSAHAAGKAGAKFTNSLDFARNVWSTVETAPDQRVNVKDYGVDPALDAAHRSVAARLKNSGNNYVQALRNALRKANPNAEGYVLEAPDYAAYLSRLRQENPLVRLKPGEEPIPFSQTGLVIPDEVRAQGKRDARDQAGVTFEVVNPDGTSRLVALTRWTEGLPGIATGHEAGHVLDWVTSPEERFQLRQQALDFYGTDGAYDYFIKYSDDVDPMRDRSADPKSWDEMSRSQQESVLDEIRAEHWNAVFNSISLDHFAVEGTSPKAKRQFIRSVYKVADRALEAMGVKRPQLTGGDASVLSGTGIELSTGLGQVLENYLSAKTLDRAFDTANGKPEAVNAPEAPATGLGEATPLAPKIPKGLEKGTRIGDVADEKGVLFGEDAKIEEVLEGDRYRVSYDDPDTGERFVRDVPGSLLRSPVSATGKPTGKPGDVIYPPHPVTPETPAGAKTVPPKTAEEIVAPKQVENVARPQGEPTKAAETPNVRTTREAQNTFAQPASPEVVKQNVAILAKHEGKPRAQRPVVETDYYAAKSPVASPDQIVREQQRQAADAAEQIGQPNPLRAIYQKVFVPYKTVTSKAGAPLVFGMSLDKVVQNVDLLRGWLKLNPKAPRAGEIGAYLNSPKLAQDVRTYLDNQAHGFAGDGRRLVRPGDARDITPEDANFTPKTLQPFEAQVINLLAGMEQPMSETPGQAFARRFAEKNGVAVQTIAGVSEPNSLRAQLRGAGFNPRILNAVVEQLRVDRMTTPLVERPDMHFPAGDTGMQRAGFMPAPRKELPVPEIASDLPRLWTLNSFWIDPNGRLYGTDNHGLFSLDHFGIGAEDLVREGWARVNVSPGDSQILVQRRKLSREAKQTLNDLRFSQRLEVVDDDGLTIFPAPDSASFMPAPRDGFYSQLERTLEAVPHNATREQIDAALRDGVKVKGQLVERPVKAEELRDVKDVNGQTFEDFLKQNPKATREEMLDFVRANQIQVNERVLRDTGFGEGVEREYTQDDWLRMSEQWERVAQQWQRNGDPEMAQRYFDKAERAARYAEGLNDEGSSAGMPKYERWQLPGGENYREIIFTRPEINPHTFTKSDLKVVEDPQRTPEDRQRFWFIERNDVGFPEFQIPKSKFATPEEAIDYVVRTKQPEPPADKNYRSSHFEDIPNYLAHARVNERTTAGGESVLFAEELQSDLHQEGRKKGYKSGLPEGYELRSENGKVGIWSERANTWTYQPVKEDTPAIRAQLVDNFKSTESLGRVLDAPFKKSWHEFVFKNLLRDAVAKGKDWLAWTTGEQQAERYDLSKQVDSVVYRSHDGGLYDVDITQGSSVIAHRKKAPLSEIESLLGKEIAKKIEAGEGDNAEDYSGGWTELSGIDLKVGGEGMKGFYDEILPRFADKYLKKYGVKTERLTLNEDLKPFGVEIADRVVARFDTRAEAVSEINRRGEGYLRYNASDNARATERPLTVHAVRLTPELKADVESKGQPLYMPRGGLREAFLDGEPLDHSIPEKTLRLTHFSPRDDLNVIDPERMSKDSTRKLLKGEPRSFWMVGKNKLAAADGAQGSKHKYEATVSGARLYDMRKDPLDLWWKPQPKIDQTLRGEGYAGFVMETKDGRQFAALYEPIAFNKKGEREAAKSRRDSEKRQQELANVRIKDTEPSYADEYAAWRKKLASGEPLFMPAVNNLVKAISHIEEARRESLENMNVNPFDRVYVATLVERAKLPPAKQELAKELSDYLRSGPGLDSQYVLETLRELRDGNSGKTVGQDSSRGRYMPARGGLAQEFLGSVNGDDVRLVAIPRGSDKFHDEFGMRGDKFRFDPKTGVVTWTDLRNEVDPLTRDVAKAKLEQKGYEVRKQEDWAGHGYSAMPAYDAFHGTNSRALAGGDTDYRIRSGMYGRAVYLTDSKAEAKTYGKYVVPVSARLEKPAKLFDPIPEDVFEPLKRLVQKASPEDVVTRDWKLDDVYQSFGDGVDPTPETEQANAILKQAGYDGLLANNRGRGIYRATDWIMPFDTASVMRKDSGARFMPLAGGLAEAGDFKRTKLPRLLDKWGWAILTAENPDSTPLTPKENRQRNASLKADLDKQGMKYVPVLGRYGGNDEHSLIVFGEEPALLELGRKYGQESILTREGLLYRDGSVQPATGVHVYDTKPKDFFTRLPDGTYFRVDIDFDAQKRPSEIVSPAQEAPLSATRLPASKLSKSSLVDVRVER